MLCHGECHSLSGELHNQCRFPHTAYTVQVLQSRYHHEGVDLFLDNPLNIHRGLVEENQQLLTIEES